MQMLRNDLPALSAYDRKYWLSIRTLSDDDLYAMIASGPSDFEPTTSADALLVGIRFEKTAAAMAEGKARLGRTLEAAREGICKRWAALKAQRMIEEEHIVGLVALVVKQQLEEPYSYLVMPLVELICRGCAYSLDALCRNCT